jgi:hypothetical protein
MERLRSSIERVVAAGRFPSERGLSEYAPARNATV